MPRREPPPRADLPADVEAELAAVASNSIEHAPGGDNGELPRESVQFTSSKAMLVQEMTPDTMRRLFPELKEPHQPETALRMLRRLVAKARKERNTKAQWANSW